MSSSSSVRDYVAEARGLNAVEQRAYLSMLGAEAWRMYRSGNMNTSLLLEMYAVDETWIVFVAGVYEVLIKCARATRFPDLNAFADFVWDHVRVREHAIRAQFMRQEHVLGRQLLEEVFHAPVEDDRVALIDRVGTFMIDHLYKEDDEYGHEYIELLTGIWFELCDIALGVEEDVSAIYAASIESLR